GCAVSHCPVPLHIYTLSLHDALPIFYALGLIFYEMLTRRRPFDAESVSGLIALHVSAPRPKLPDEFSEYQGLLDRMIAVEPRNRFKRADEVLEAIDEVWTQQALRALKQGR